MGNDIGDKLEINHNYNPIPTSYSILVGGKTLDKLETLHMETLRAKSEMEYQRNFGGFGYKQAKRRYERLVNQYNRMKRSINEGIRWKMDNR